MPLPISARSTFALPLASPSIRKEKIRLSQTPADAVANEAAKTITERIAPPPEKTCSFVFFISDVSFLGDETIPSRMYYPKFSFRVSRGCAEGSKYRGRNVGKGVYLITKFLPPGAEGHERNRVKRVATRPHRLNVAVV